MVCGGLGMLALYGVRAGWFRGSTPAYDTTSAIEEGARVYASMRMTRPEELREPGAMRAWLSQMTWYVEPGVPPMHAEALRGEIETFFRLRFVEPDAAAYRRWRESRGCRFTSLAELDRKTDVLKDYEAVFGRPLPANATIESLYAEYWDRTTEMFGGTNLLAGFARDAIGLQVRVGHSTDQVHPRLKLEGVLGERLWYGPTAGTMRRWFDLPIEPRDIVRARGRVLVAEFGVVCEFADGSRRPINGAFVYVPERAGWVLWLLNQNNYDLQRTRVSPLGY